MENIIIGALGGAAYALSGLFKNKYDLDKKFKLYPSKALASVIIGAIIGGVYGATGLPEPQIVVLIGSLGVNKGVKALVKIIFNEVGSLFKGK